MTLRLSARSIAGRRLVGPLLAVPILALGLGLVSTPASTVLAVSAPDGAWTQIDNHGYPTSGASKDCNPCEAWPIASYNKYYQNLLNGYFATDAKQAVTDWNGLPDRNPVFHSTNQSADLTITAKDLAAAGFPKACALTSPYMASSTQIGAAAVWLSTTKSYTDGPNANGVCDVRDALHHEMGHVNAQGHSSKSTDLMYWQNNGIDVIDADARAGDRAIYGALPSSGNTAPPPAPGSSPTPTPSASPTDPPCPRCRFVSLPGVGLVYVPVDPQGIADDTQAIIDYKLGEDIPAVIVPSIQPPPCAGSVQVASIPIPVCPLIFVNG